MARALRIAAFLLAAGTALAQPQPLPRFDAQRESAALRYDRNGIPIARVEVNGHAVELGIDTGAGMTVLSDSAARHAGVRELRPAPMPVFDSLGQSIPARIGVAEVRVAGMAIDALPVLVLPDERLRARTLGATMFEFEGLLGWNAMESSRVTLDYARGQLRFDPPRSDCGPRTLWSVNSRPLVAFEADGTRGRAFVDTGARTSALVSTGEAGDGEHTRLVAGASGVSLRREGLRRGVTFASGGQRWEGRAMPVTARGEHDLHDALIGNDLLAGRRVEIDAGCGEFSIGAPPR